MTERGQCRFGTRDVSEWSWRALPQILAYLPILNEMVSRVGPAWGNPLLWNIYILKSFQWDPSFYNVGENFFPNYFN